MMPWLRRRSEPSSGGLQRSEEELPAVDAFRVTREAHWLPEEHNLPVTISFTCTADVAGSELHPHLATTSQREHPTRTATRLCEGREPIDPHHLGAVRAPASSAASHGVVSS